MGRRRPRRLYYGLIIGAIGVAFLQPGSPRAQQAPAAKAISRRLRQRSRRLRQIPARRHTLGRRPARRVMRTFTPAGEKSALEADVQGRGDRQARLRSLPRAWEVTLTAAVTRPRYSPSKVHRRKEITSRCLDCHAGGTQHMSAINSVHLRNDVSCISCHSPHHARESQFLLVKSQPELCYSCHLAAKSAVRHALPSSRE